MCPARASALASAHFGLILVLKAMRSAVDALYRAGLVGLVPLGVRDRPARQVHAEASKLSRKPIRAEDIAGWGV